MTRVFEVGKTYWERSGKGLECTIKQDELGRVYFSDRGWRYGADHPDGKHRMGDFGYEQLKDIPQAIDMARSFPDFLPELPSQMEMFE